MRIVSLLRIMRNNAERMVCVNMRVRLIFANFTAIYEGKNKYVTNYTIDSNRHYLETKEQYKIAIDPFDDKGISSISETSSQMGLRPYFTISDFA